MRQPCLFLAIVVVASLPDLLNCYGPPAVKGGNKKPVEIPANFPPPTEEFKGTISTCGPSCAGGTHSTVPQDSAPTDYAQNPFLSGGVPVNGNTPHQQQTGSSPATGCAGGTSCGSHQGSQSNNNPNYANNPFINGNQQGCSGNACGGSPQGPVHSQGPAQSQGPVHSQGPAPQGGNAPNYGNNPFLSGNQQGCSGSTCGGSPQGPLSQGPVHSQGPSSQGPVHSQGPTQQEQGNYANNPFLSGGVSQTSCSGAACGQGTQGSDYSQNPFLSGQVPQGQAPQGQAPKQPGFGGSSPQQQPGFGGSSPQQGVVCQAGTVCINARICNNGYVNPNNAQQAKKQGSQCNVAAGEVCCSVTSRNDGPGLVHVQPAPGSKPGLVHVSPSNNAPGFINPQPSAPGTIRNPVTQRPQFITTNKPYTGPQNVTPHPGCAAALKCVTIEFCTWEGVMSDVPVALTREENESRVPLMECANLEGGFVGKCCRDPNYKDPWPDMLPGGGCYENTRCEAMERCDNNRMAMPKATCNLPQQGRLGICCTSGPSNNNNFVQQTSSNNQQGFVQNKPVQPSYPQDGPQQNFPSAVNTNPGFVNKPNVVPASYPQQQPQQPAFPARPIVNQPQNTGFPPKQPNPGFVNQQPQNSGFSSKPNNPVIPQQQVVPSNPNSGFGKPDYQQTDFIDKVDNSPPIFEQGSTSPDFSQQLIGSQQGPKNEINQIEISGSPQNPTYLSQTQFFQQQSPVGGSSYPKPAPPNQQNNQFNQPKPQAPQFGQQQPKPQTPQFGEPQIPPFNQQPQPQTPQFGDAQIPPFNQQPQLLAPQHGQQPQTPAQFGQDSQSLIPPQYPQLSSQLNPGKVCGVRRVSQVSGLQGQDGQSVPGEFPWMALVVLPSNQTRLCAGALISEKAVLTSAHCVLGLNPSDLQVEVGSWSPYENNPERQSSGVVAVARHPKFEPGTLGSDLAVLLLAVPFHLGQHVDTVCLPDVAQIGPDGELRNPGGACVMSSWPKQGGPEGYLHRLAMSTVPKAKCEESLRQTYLGKYFQLNRSFLCAKPVDPQQDICSVGLGGPLVCPQQDGRYVVTAASSWDVGCSERRSPSVLCAVDITWVNEVLARPVEDFIVQAPNQENVHVVDPSVANKKPGFSQGYGR